MEMDAQRAPATFEQNVEIATRLRGFHHAKARAVAGNGQVLGVVRSDLEEHTAVWPALVSLSGRMQKARTEFEAGRDVAAIAQRQPPRLQARHVCLVMREVGQDRDIIPGAEPREMRLEPTIDAAVGAGLAQRFGVILVGVEREGSVGTDRRFARQCSRFLKSVGQLTRLVFARFDVGLIERIDADHGAGNRSGDLEAEELLADMIERILHDADHRMAGFLQCLKFRLMTFVGLAFQREIDEAAIVAVDFRSAERLAVHGDQALAVFAGQFRKQLLSPGAEIG